MKKILIYLLLLGMIVPMALLPSAKADQADALLEVEKKPFYLAQYHEDAKNPGDVDYENIYKMIMFDYVNYLEGDEHPRIKWAGTYNITDLAWALKEECDKRPAGTRIVHIQTPIDTVFEPEAMIYLEDGTALFADWFEKFFKVYKAIGGKLDGVAIDVEYSSIGAYYIHKAYRLETSTVDPEEGTTIKIPRYETVYQDIVNHPLYATEVRPLLEERGFHFVDPSEYGNYEVAADKASEVVSISARPSAEYNIWNAVMRNRMCDYINEMVAPVMEYFPEATVSNYRFPSAKGWQGTGSSGNTGYAGNTANENFYLRRPGAGYFYNKGYLYSTPLFYNEAVYEDTPFNALQYEANVFKDMYESLSYDESDDKRISAWIAGFNYNSNSNIVNISGDNYYTSNSLRLTPYYSETIYHIGLMDPEVIMGYIVGPRDTDNNGDGYNYQDNMKVISELLDELTRVAGTADRKPIEMPTNWNSSFVLSGMYSAGRNIWRISPDTTSGMTLEDFKVNDQAPTFYINGQTVIFPQGRIIEDSEISYIGTCGYWIETPADVTPVIINDEDRLDKPAFEEDFESYAAGTALTSSNAKYTSTWVNDSTVTVKSQGGSNALYIPESAGIQLTKLPQNVTAGDSYALQQTWEVDFSVPSTKGDIYLMQPNGEGGIKINNRVAYYDNGGSYTSFGVTLTANKFYTAKMELDFRGSTYYCSYYIYDNSGNLVASAANIKMDSSISIPVTSIDFSVSYTWLYSPNAYIDNFKMRATGVTTDFNLYDVHTGMRLSEKEENVPRTEDTAYRLSWMNATHDYKIAKIYNNGTLVKEVPMAPGADGVITGIVEGSSKLYVETVDGTAPTLPDYNQGDFNWSSGVTVVEETPDNIPNEIDKSILFDINFVDSDGTLLEAQHYSYGDKVTPPADPVKIVDDNNTYTFVGWHKTVGDCLVDYTYIARFACNGWTYQIKGNEVTLCGYVGTDTVLVMPDTIEGKPVTAINGSAFYGNTKMVSMVISKNVRTIGGSAFYGCSALAHVEIPEGVTAIGTHAFRECFALTTITLPESLASIGELAFFKCTKLSTINIPKNVTAIGSRAFNYCDSLTGIWVDADNTKYSSDSYGVLFNKAQTTLIVMPGAFQGSYITPSTVTKLENFAFYRCRSLTRVVIPAGITSIGNYLFDGNKSMISVTLPAEITSIGDYAFRSCSALKNVFFTGTQAQWDAITISTASNDPLKNATLTCNFTDEMLSHTYTSKTVAATCISKGYTLYTCTKCGDCYTADETALAGHVSQVIPGKEATCISAGATEGSKCSICGVILKKQEVIATGGHTLTIVPGKAPTCTEPGLTDAKQCVLCKEILSVQTTVDALGHKWTDATCTAPKTCSSCGLTEGAALGHQPQTVPAKAPTCTEPGLSEGKRCSVCSKVLTAQTVVDALGHTPKTVSGKAPTCTEPGLSDGSECSVCNEIVTEQKEIPALGHNYTVTETDSNYKVLTCNVCGHTSIARDVTIKILDYTGTVTTIPVVAGDVLYATTSDITVDYVYNKKSYTSTTGVVSAFSAVNPGEGKWNIKIDNTADPAVLTFDGAVFGHTLTSGNRLDLFNISGEGSLLIVTKSDSTIKYIRGDGLVTAMQGGTTYTSVDGALLHVNGLLNTSINGGTGAVVNEAGTLTFRNANVAIEGQHSSGTYYTLNAIDLVIENSVVKLRCRNTTMGGMKTTGDLTINGSDLFIYNYGVVAAMNIAGAFEMDSTSILGIYTQANVASAGNVMNKMPTTDGLVGKYMDYSEENALDGDETIATVYDKWFAYVVNEDTPWISLDVDAGQPVKHNIICIVACGHENAGEQTSCAAVICPDCNSVAFAEKEHVGGNATCLVKATCTVCGTAYGELADHIPGAEATCTTAQACTVCNAELAPAKGHTAGKTVVENSVAANCTNAGSYDNVVYCTVCSTELSRNTVTVNALGHTAGAEATCTTAQVCTVCNAELAPAKGHTAGQKVIENEKPASYTETGSYEEVVYCASCGAELSRTVVTVPMLEREGIPGDIDGNETVDQDDAVYLLLNTLFGETFYPLGDVDADIDGNGTVNQDDAVYLLLHTLFGETFYPLNTPALPAKIKSEGEQL